MESALVQYARANPDVQQLPPCKGSDGVCTSDTCIIVPITHHIFGCLNRFGIGHICSLDQESCPVDTVTRSMVCTVSGFVVRRSPVSEGMEAIKDLLYSGHIGGGRLMQDADQAGERINLNNGFADSRVSDAREARFLEYEQQFMEVWFDLVYSDSRREVDVARSKHVLSSINFKTLTDIHNQLSQSSTAMSLIPSPVTANGTKFKGRNDAVWVPVQAMMELALRLTEPVRCYVNSSVETRRKKCARDNVVEILLKESYNWLVALSRYLNVVKWRRHETRLLRTISNSRQSPVVSDTNTVDVPVDDTYVTVADDNIEEEDEEETDTVLRGRKKIKTDPTSEKTVRSVKSHGAYDIVEHIIAYLFDRDTSWWNSSFSEFKGVLGLDVLLPNTADLSKLGYNDAGVHRHSMMMKSARKFYEEFG